MKNKPVIISEGNITLNNTNTFRWDKGSIDSRKGYLSVTVVGESEEMKSQSVIFNDGGTSPSTVQKHYLHPNNWNDQYKDKPTLKSDDVYEQHIRFEDINSYDDIFRLTNSGDYSKLHKWNQSGDYHRLIPVLWVQEKKRGSSWGTFTHSLETFYMLKLFNTQYDYIDVLDSLSDVKVIESGSSRSSKYLDGLGEDWVQIENPKLPHLQFLNRKTEQYIKIDVGLNLIK